MRCPSSSFLRSGCCAAVWAEPSCAELHGRDVSREPLKEAISDWIDSFEALIDFLSVVIVQAPDEFLREDYLDDSDQLTLDLAFQELRDGMQFVKERIKDKAVVLQLQNCLTASLAAYRAGDDVRGAHLLQDFQRLLIEKNP